MGALFDYLQQKELQLRFACLSQCSFLCGTGEENFRSRRSARRRKAGHSFAPSQTAFLFAQLPNTPRLLTYEYSVPQSSASTLPETTTKKSRRRISKMACKHVSAPGEPEFSHPTFSMFKPEGHIRTNGLGRPPHLFAAQIGLLASLHCPSLT